VRLRISLSFSRDFRDVSLASYLYFRLAIGYSFSELLIVVPLGNSVLNPPIYGQIRDLSLVFIWIYRSTSTTSTIASNTLR
jgi:hypothetical protein